MSHSVPIKTEFKSKPAMRKAFEALGWSLKENAKIRSYSSDPARLKTYELVAVNPRNGYDVGITIGENGEIDLICDWYSPGRIAETLGANFTELKKKYCIEVTNEHYEQVTIEQMFADGSFIILADDGQ
jgi:hypothetical protein